MVEISRIPDRELSEQFAKMREIVRDLPVQMDRIVYPHASHGSASKNFDQLWDQEFVYRYLAMSGHYLIATEHNLERALTPWVLGRASLEASARVAWISAFPEQMNERNYAAQLDDIPDVRDDLKYQIQNDIIRKAKLQSIGKSPFDLKKIVPRKRRMIEKSLGMGRVYDQWSRISHNNTYWVMVVSMSITDHGISSLIPGIVWAYGIASWNFFVSWSLPRDELENLLTEAGAAIGLPQKFWERFPELV